MRTFNALHAPTQARLWGPYTGSDEDIVELSGIAEIALPVSKPGVILVRNPEVDRNKIARNSTEWQELAVGGYVVFQPTGCVYPISATAFARSWEEVKREVYPS